MSSVRGRERLLRSGAMAPRRSAAAESGRHAAPPRRGMTAVVAVAVVAIGAGTWALGSGPDAGPAREGADTVVVVPEVPVEQQAPALSVAPAPSDSAYAAARRASRDKAAARKKAPAKSTASALAPSPIRLGTLLRTGTAAKAEPKSGTTTRTAPRTTTTKTTTTKTTSTTAPRTTTTKPTTTKTTTTSASPTLSPGESAFRSRVVALTNAARSKAGCGALVVDSRLVRSADGHSADMAANDYFAHDGLDGSSFVDRIRAAGYTKPAAENIAHGQVTADRVVEMWLASPGHKANMLNCQISRIGVGFDPRGNYWTQDFGY